MSRARPALPDDANDEQDNQAEYGKSTRVHQRCAGEIGDNREEEPLGRPGAVRWRWGVGVAWGYTLLVELFHVLIVIQ